MMLSWKNALVPITGNFCAVLISIWITSHADGKPVSTDVGRALQPTAEKLRFCGIRLRLEIESVCNSSSAINGYYRPGVPRILYPQHSYPSLATDNRIFQQGKTVPVRVPRGVIEECCQNPCFREDLFKYCGVANNRSGSNTTTSETPLQVQLLHKRKQSSVGKRAPKKRTLDTKRKHRKILDNCLHCARSKNRNVSNVDRGCGRSRRKTRRRKPRLEERDAILLPLLLQLLWNNWDNGVKGSNSLKNFLPYQEARRLRPGATRGISPRDIYQRHFHILQSQPASDETNRSDSDGGQSEDSNQSAPRVISRASQVTDAPVREFFNIPAGTNDQFYSP